MVNEFTGAYLAGAVEGVQDIVELRDLQCEGSAQAGGACVQVAHVLDARRQVLQA